MPHKERRRRDWRERAKHGAKYIKKETHSNNNCLNRRETGPFECDYKKACSMCK